MMDERPDLRSNIRCLALGFHFASACYPEDSQLYVEADIFPAEMLKLAKAVKDGLGKIFSHPAIAPKPMKATDQEVHGPASAGASPADPASAGPGSAGPGSADLQSVSTAASIYRGLHIAYTWTGHITSKHLVWGPMIAHGLTEGRGVMKWNEDVVPGPLDRSPWDSVQHVAFFLKWLKEVLLSCDAWTVSLDRREDALAQALPERALKAADPAFSLPTTYYLAFNLLQI